MGNNDVIGGGVGDSTVSTQNDIFIYDNHVVQDASIGAGYGAAIDMVAPYRFHFSRNMTIGHVIFGAEQWPHKFAKITDNIIKTGPGIGAVTLGLAVDPAAMTAGQAIIISGNVVEGGLIDAFSNPSSTLLIDTIISNNVVYADGTDEVTGTGGIRAVHMSHGIISGNAVYSSTSHGIWVTAGDNLTISGNNVSDSIGQGIWLEGTTDSSVTDNHVTGGSLYAIKNSGGSDRNFITDNNLIDNASGPFSIVGSDVHHVNNHGYGTNGLGDI
jgi:parallel beta-helix repeat protein